LRNEDINDKNAFSTNESIILLGLLLTITRAQSKA